MKMSDYLREKSGWLAGGFLELMIIIALGKAFEISSVYVVCVVFLQVVGNGLFLVIEYRKKSRFYNDMSAKLEELDQKYLITEMIQKPDFLEGDIFCEALYDIDKSMNERVRDVEHSVNEFKEYVEMWIHEIKLPISAISLMSYNGKTDSGKYKEQVDKISHYVEQILYYVRADAPEKDFLMKKCSLEPIINSVLMEYKEVLIAGRFTIEKEHTDTSVLSDAKWVQFMIGQIVNNSVKYRRGENGYLRFVVTEDKSSVCLSVEDHGIGIGSTDVKRVFDKSFTGENGRKVGASTGMGLYICRKMCDKLGHKICIESEEGVYTRVMIRFGKDDYYFR